MMNRKVIEAIEQEVRDKEKAKRDLDKELAVLDRTLSILSNGSAPRRSPGPQPDGASRMVFVEKITNILKKAPADGMPRRKLEEKLGVDAWRVKQLLPDLIKQNIVVQTNAPARRGTKFRLAAEVIRLRAGEGVIA